MPRRAAWSILRSGSPTPLREVGGLARKLGLEPRERALLRRLVGTEIRRRATLRALVRHFGAKKPDPDLAAHLHLGLVQLFFLDRVPDHAAVSETVREVRNTLGPARVRFANAVLRSALRARREGHCGDPRRDLVARDLHLAEPVFRDPAEHPLLWGEDALSMPAPILKRWSARFGQETAFALARFALEEPPLSVRAAGVERDALAAELEAADLHPRPGRHDRILLLPPAETEAFAATAAFGEGRATVQGESALLAAEAVQAAPGERVLDVCAAPGGKSAVLAEAGANVVACDLRPRRLERLASTVARLGLAGHVRAVAMDGARALAPEAFDAALVDAPCTNTGVLAQRPEARWRFGPAAAASLALLQARLLAEAAQRVRPGGRLVWSTCSLEPAENRRQVERLLAERPGWELEEERETLPDTSTGAGTGAGPTDGGWFARLRRRCKV